jgi:hypothetical protein
MTTEGGVRAVSGLRELLVVLGLALGGLLIATVVAFSPWYAAAAGEGAPPLVDVDTSIEPLTTGGPSETGEASKAEEASG